MNYKTIGEEITEAEFNAYVCLLRQHGGINENLVIEAAVMENEYGTFNFNFDGATLVDNGILITEETKENPPNILLENALFENSSYTLMFKVMSIEDYNLYEDTRQNFISYETFSLELEEGAAIDLPVSELEEGKVILFDVLFSIKHDKPVIQIIE